MWGRAELFDVAFTVTKGDKSAYQAADINFDDDQGNGISMNQFSRFWYYSDWHGRIMRLWLS